MENRIPQNSSDDEIKKAWLKNMFETGKKLKAILKVHPDWLDHPENGIYPLTLAHKMIDYADGKIDGDSVLKEFVAFVTQHPNN